MNLRERLRSLGVKPSTGAGQGEARREGFVPKVSEPPIVDAQQPDPIDFGPDIALQSFPTGAGTALGTQALYPLDYEQGRIPLDAALNVPETGWRRLLPIAEQPFPIERAVFLDLETTGLARAAGTYAFLIGVGRFTEDGFRLRQFFMRDYDDELNHLEALRTELADAEAIVTFNGRSFDWPLLETRAIMNRLRLPLLPHLDLLHPARRVWRPIIGGCSLGELETAVLDVVRVDDVPGYLIPQRYFDFLQTGDAAPLVDVLHHNRLDILSMVALVGRIGHALAAPRKPSPGAPGNSHPAGSHPGGQALSAAELFTIGRWLLPDPEGVRCLEEALARGTSWDPRSDSPLAPAPAPAPEPALTPDARALPPALYRQCSELLATTYKRLERWDDAVAIWEDLTSDVRLSTWAFIELAKHYEHQVGDLQKAREWTMRALDSLQRRRLLSRAALAHISNSSVPTLGTKSPLPIRNPSPQGSGRWGQELAAVRHRLHRLERKLAR